MNRYADSLRRHLDGVIVSGRWTPQRKADLLNLLDVGGIALAEACDTYGLTASEIANWRDRKARHGIDGLKVHKLQETGR